MSRAPRGELMKIRVQKGSFTKNEPVDVDDVTYVAAFDERDGTPITVIEQLGRDVVHVTHCNDPEFSYVLQRLGIKEAAPTPVLPGTAVKP